MVKFIPAERTTSDRVFYINIQYITTVGYGDDNDSTKIEIGERSLVIKGSVDEVMAKINAA